MTDFKRHFAQLGLKRNPFPGTPDAACYFVTPELDEHRVELAHCIQARKGISLLTADVGMGKSTLVRRLMSDLADRSVVSALVFNTFLQGNELLVAVLQDFGLTGTGSMSTDIAELNIFLLRNHQAGKTCLLIIDDAQNLSDSSLELVRLLCNLETDQEKLLQILLAGQPELEQILSGHALRQLRSRIVKHVRLHPLSCAEVADYVRFRLGSAGDGATITLAPQACRLLWQETAGVPRHLHLVMDRCLYGLIAQGGISVDADLMRVAIADSRIALNMPANRPTAPHKAVARAGWAVAGAALAGVAAVAFAALSDNAPGRPVPVGYSTSANAVSSGNGMAPLDASASIAVVAPTSTSPPVGPGPASTAVFDAESEASAKQDHCDVSPVAAADQIVSRRLLPALTDQLLGSRLQALSGACREQRDGASWLTWASPANGYDLARGAGALRMQQGLVAYGSLDASQADGLWGPHSRAALRQFQSQIGLSATGDMDALSGLFLERFYVPGL